MFLDLLYPKKCIDCKKKGGYICIKCIKEVNFPIKICPVCSRFSAKGKTHTRCQDNLSLDGLTCIWKYRGVIKKSIITLKYKFITEIADEISDLTVFLLKRNKNLSKMKKVFLISVPMLKARENWRGFNQSELMGKKIAKKMNWKFIPNLLIKTKATPHQTGLPRHQRTKNILDSFSLNPKYKKPDSKSHIQYSLIIFDDVWTTGSTLKEACKTLKKTGFRKVWGLTLAR